VLEGTCDEAPRGDIKIVLADMNAQMADKIYIHQQLVNTAYIPKLTTME
jgi:hypothetical protein